MLWQKQGHRAPHTIKMMGRTVSQIKRDKQGALVRVVETCNLDKGQNTIPLLCYHH